MTLSPRRVSLLVATNTALAPFAIDAYLPAMASLADSVGASIHHAELSISVFMAGFAIGQLLFGPVSDRLGRKPVLLSGLVVFLLASLMLATVGSLTELLAWRFVQALGGGACVVNSTAIVRDCFSGRQAASVISTMAMIMMLAPLVAPLVGSGLLYLADWQLIFIFLAAYAAFLLWLMSTRLPETRDPNQPTASLGQVLVNYVSVLRHREGLGYICAVAASFGGLFAFVTASPYVYMDHFGLTPATYPFVLGANVIFIALSNRINIHLLQTRTPLQNLYLGLVLQLVAVVCLVVVVMAGLASLPVVVLLVMLYSGMIGLISPNAMALLLDRFGHMSATATALMGAAKFGAAALAGIMVGAFEIENLWPMVLTMLAASLFGNVMLSRLAGRPVHA
ncbi:MAG: multidrug effflux MFS transporter [Halomonas sp.]|nr:multidrug effflux MFS transporter [Halomonas sp.]